MLEASVRHASAPLQMQRVFKIARLFVLASERETSLRRTSSYSGTVSIPIYALSVEWMDAGGLGVPSVSGRGGKLNRVSIVQEKKKHDQKASNGIADWLMETQTRLR